MKFNLSSNINQNKTNFLHRTTITCGIFSQDSKRIYHRFHCRVYFIITCYLLVSRCVCNSLSVVTTVKPIAKQTGTDQWHTFYTIKHFNKWPSFSITATVKRFEKEPGIDPNQSLDSNNLPVVTTVKPSKQFGSAKLSDEQSQSFYTRELDSSNLSAVTTVKPRKKFGFTRLSEVQSQLFYAKELDSSNLSVVTTVKPRKKFGFAKLLEEQTQSFYTREINSSNLPVVTTVKPRKKFGFTRLLEVQSQLFYTRELDSSNLSVVTTIKPRKKFGFAKLLEEQTQSFYTRELDSSNLPVVTTVKPRKKVGFTRLSEVQSQLFHTRELDSSNLSVVKTIKPRKKFGFAKLSEEQTQSFYTRELDSSNLPVVTTVKPRKIFGFTKLSEEQSQSFQTRELDSSNLSVVTSATPTKLTSIKRLSTKQSRIEQSTNQTDSELSRSLGDTETDEPTTLNASVQASSFSMQPSTTSKTNFQNITMSANSTSDNYSINLTHDEQPNIKDNVILDKNVNTSEFAITQFLTETSANSDINITPTIVMVQQSIFKTSAQSQDVLGQYDEQPTTVVMNTELETPNENIQIRPTTFELIKISNRLEKKLNNYEFITETQSLTVAFSQPYFLEAMNINTKQLDIDTEPLESTTKDLSNDFAVIPNAQQSIAPTGNIKYTAPNEIVQTTNYVIYRTNKESETIHQYNVRDAARTQNVTMGNPLTHSSIGHNNNYHLGTVKTNLPINENMQHSDLTSRQPLIETKTKHHNYSNTEFQHVTSTSTQQNFSEMMLNENDKNDTTTNVPSLTKHLGYSGLSSTESNQTPTESIFQRYAKFKTETQNKTNTIAPQNYIEIITHIDSNIIKRNTFVNDALTSGHIPLHVPCQLMIAFMLVCGLMTK